mmetsp:Transcript_43788/g.136291  ORF Transcript_43788/g.136291 Transcript_43788/m.136291 type:complete len:208 (-) Transcript_43788:524-1147(-)
MLPGAREGAGHGQGQRGVLREGHEEAGALRLPAPRPPRRRQDLPPVHPEALQERGLPVKGYRGCDQQRQQDRASHGHHAGRRFQALGPAYQPRGGAGAPRGHLALHSGRGAGLLPRAPRRVHLAPVDGLQLPGSEQHAVRGHGHVSGDVAHAEGLEGGGHVHLGGLHIHSAEAQGNAAARYQLLDGVRLARLRLRRCGAARCAQGLE